MVSHTNDRRERQGRVYRRRFLQAAAVGGAMIGGSGSVTAQTTEIELDGETAGWVGRSPSDIEGETNPTLTLETGQDYALTWMNTDGAPHNFAIDDGDEDLVGPTDQVAEEGESQTVEFTATEEMSEYYCPMHPQSMRGSIELIGEENEETGDADEGNEFESRIASIRDFGNENYEIAYTYRKRQAIETLLSDPEVNDVVGDFISSFEAYDAHTEDLDSISIQGSPDVEIEGGIDEGAFEVTVVDRQVAYGLIDRQSDEIVALTITEPEDVTWTPWEAEEEGERAVDIGEQRLETVLENSDVQDYLEGKEWYPLFKVAEEITSARGIEHAGVSPVVLFVKEDDGLAALAAYLDVREDDAGELIDVVQMDRFVEFPPHELAHDVEIEDESVLDSVPDVSFEQRPWFTANNGFHRLEEPDESFDQSGWSIDWEPPGTHGVRIAAEYEGSPVFASLDAPITYTGYNLPERQGENTLEWFFPDNDPVFVGDLLFWDIHSIEFGGPGQMGVIEYPETENQPEGFRFRTHYHTGAYERESLDFHSGHRFGPYNYDISYEFFEDGMLAPIWRRQGPGFITEYIDDDDGQNGENAVVQHYISTIAMDVTPGTDEGVEVQLFDGDEWLTPESEFYVEGEQGMIARFSNPDGSETIDIPLDDDKEVVVVRRAEGEIGVEQRVEDMDIESEFYHPAQYVNDDPIQGERVYAWLLMEAATDDVPHPSGITSFVTHSQIQLSGY